MVWQTGRQNQESIPAIPVQVKVTGMRHIQFQTLLVFVLAAGTVLARALYPPGKTVTGLTWDSNPVRLSDGSGDNWPVVESEDGVP
jgi:hypothetical protein